MNPEYASAHKRVYSKAIDSLDAETVRKIMENPNCRESILLNIKVDSEVQKILAPAKESV